MWNHDYDMTFYLLPSGLAPEAARRSHIAGWSTNNGEDGMDPEPPIELRDVNRDGYRDLVEYELADRERCNGEETAPDILGEGELNPCLRANRAKLIYPYARADKWSPAPLAWLEKLLARLAR